jgi:hypothetical protein
MRARLPLLVLFLLVSTAAAARAAEEVFVLDNGSVFRGHVVQDGEQVVRLRLSGFADAVVNLERSRIVNRFVPATAPPAPSRPQTSFDDWMASTRSATASDASESDGPARLPEEEPDIHDESFFQRMARVTVLALPSSIGGRLTLGALFLFGVVSLMFLGARMVEVETLTTGIAILLAGLLAGAFAVNVLYYEDMLRADRAPWILPLQGILWLGVASATLRCGFERVFVLFAFVSFSLALAVFAAGAILVSY